VSVDKDPMRHADQESVKFFASQPQLPQKENQNPPQSKEMQRKKQQNVDLSIWRQRGR
jgi:hypothetical protein